MIEQKIYAIKRHELLSLMDGYFDYNQISI